MILFMQAPAWHVKQGRDHLYDVTAFDFGGEPDEQSVKRDFE